ncbi:MAG: Holliday junction branch migration protein RuvA [Ignavibacteria bacterium]|nr:Holliday junction branch migration protein RuvA [Ignavibacteria bacterium]
MIASLKGILKTKAPTEVLLDVGGIGYAVNIPISTSEKLGAVGTEILLFTHLHVREDALQLYGFATEEERSLFRLLISVTGIGPKIAQGIMSGVSTDELQHHIIAGDTNALSSIPNIGKKTAERLIVELRDKLTKGGAVTAPTGRRSDDGVQLRGDALQALISLGFARASAEKALRQALNEAGSKPTSIEELIKKALRQMSSK